MDREKLQEWAAAYSLGALEGEERRTFEALLRRGDAEALRLLQEMEAVAQQLPFSAEPVMPPPGLKARILEALEENLPVAPANEPAAGGVPTSAREAQPAGGRERWKWFARAAVVALLLLSAGALIYITQLRHTIRELQQQVAMSGQVIQQLTEQLHSQQQLLALFQAPELRIYDLAGQAPAPNAAGKVYLDPARRTGLFLGHNLAAPPPDKDYQLWMLRGNQPIDAGILTPDKSGNYIATFDVAVDAGELTAFAVTVEPRGGVPQPTGAMVLLGAIN